MALTLAQAKVGMTNKVDQFVIELFERNSRILAKMVFDDDASLQGGSTLAYVFQQEKTPSVAAGRAINSAYTANEAVREQKTVNLIIFGGSYELDRVIAKTGARALNEIEYQTESKVKGSVNLFHYLLINGNHTVDSTVFDGLDIQLWETSTEIKGLSLDIAAMTDAEAQELLNNIDLAISKMVRKPDAMIVNSLMKVKIKEAARRVGYLRHDVNAFGEGTDYYDGTVEIIDAGQYYGANGLVDIVPIRAADEYRVVTVTADTFVTDGTLYTESSGTYTAVNSGSYNSATTYYKLVGAANTSDIYFTCFGREELCGISLNGQKIVETYLPDLEHAGEVVKGSVEAVWGVALKNSRAAAVVRGIKLK